MNIKDEKLMTAIAKWCFVFIMGFALGLVAQLAKADTGISIGNGLAFNSDSQEISAYYITESERFKVMGSVWNHDEAEAAISVLVRPFNLPTYSSVGRNPFRIYVGAAYINKVNSINGTKLNFIFNPVWYITKDISIYYTHYSNGRRIGIGPEDKPNRGWNYIGLGYNF